MNIHERLEALYRVIGVPNPEVVYKKHVIDKVVCGVMYDLYEDEVDEELETSERLWKDCNGLD